MNDKPAKLGMKPAPQRICVIQPTWWVDEAKVINIRRRHVPVRAQARFSNAEAIRQSKQTSALKPPHPQIVLTKELIC